ncbi:hypothetical protein, partial [Dokdonella sp.]|uniref:hypothetical protein n=1 Tax=Dokdonella sp. TaxID=2291710 RepID=UPI003C333FFB
VFLIARTGTEIQRIELPIERASRVSSTEIPMRDRAPLIAKLTVAPDGVHLELCSDEPIDRAYAKLERLGHRVLIYDRHGWKAKGSVASFA